MNRPLAVGLLALAALPGCRATEPPAPLALHEEALARWDEGLPPPAVPPPAVPAMVAVPESSQVSEPAPVPVVFRDPAPRAMQLRDAELGHALRLLAGMGGTNFVLVGDFSQPVDMDLPDVPLQTALEVLVRTYGCSVEKQGDVVVIRREDPERALTRVYTLRSIAAASVQPQLASLVGDGGLVVNAARNVVMITAPEAQLRKVEAYLASVDQPDRQVLIEARILEVTRTDLEELGTKIQFHDIAIDDGTATFVSSLLTSNTQILGTIASDDGSFDAAINALHQLVGLQVLSRPRLLALNNKEARLDIVKEIPYVQATTTTQGSTTSVGTQTIQQIEYKNVGLKLLLTPSVLEGGLISLSVDQEISDQTGTFLSVPIVDSRHIVTSFVVQEGQTIMLGGIMSDRRSDSSDGVPMLMDLPVLGQAFRNNSDEANGVELIILMTPRLVDPRATGNAAIAGGSSMVGSVAVGTTAGASTGAAAAPGP